MNNKLTSMQNEINSVISSNLKIKEYHEFIINEDDSFYIIESNIKPKNPYAALEALKKIQYIVKHRLDYDANIHDAYSSKSQGELFKLLKQKSEEIHKGYYEKQLKLNWLFRKIFSQEKEISSISTSINNYINPPRALPLPNELIQEVCEYLSFSDLKNFSLVNRHAKVHALKAISKKTKELGSENEDCCEAIKYMNTLSMELQKLNRNINVKETDLEKNLQTLADLPLKKLRVIFYFSIENEYQHLLELLIRKRSTRKILDFDLTEFLKEIRAKRLSVSTAIGFYHLMNNSVTNLILQFGIV